MTLKEYIANLQKFIEENPDAAGYKVVVSLDDEDNLFSEIHNNPTIGHFDYSDDDFCNSDDSVYQLNAVCIN